MSEQVIEVHICGAVYSQEEVTEDECPVCKKRTKFLNQFQEYYGWRCTCSECGESWVEGERLRHSGAKGWREARIKMIIKKIEEIEKRVSGPSSNDDNSEVG
jgi:transcription initiation factor IIE alpha subunit